MRSPHTRRLLASLALPATMLVPALRAQCNPATALKSNWILPFEDQIELGVDARSVVVTNPYPYPIELCQVSFYMSTNCLTHRDLPLDIYTVDPQTGAPDTLVGTGGVLSVQRSAGVVSTGFPNPPTLQAHTSYHFVIDYDNNQGCNGPFGGGIKRSVSTAGTVRESWEYFGLTGKWQRDDQRIMYEITNKPAVTARYTTFGAGCGGGAPCSTTPFQSFNWGQPLLGATSNAGIHYAIQVKDQSGLPTRDLCSVELLTNALPAGAAVVDVAIYDEGNALPRQILGTTTITVQPGAPTSYLARFPSPVRIAAGTNYWVDLLAHGSIVLPIAQFGTTLTHATSSNGTTWSRFSQYSWSLRTYLTTGKAPLVPKLSGTSPKIGTTMKVSVSGAQPSAPAVLLFGMGNPSLDLTSLGAPGCRLLCSGEASISMQTNALGDASANIPIPNSTVLLQGQFYNQVVVQSPATQLGITLSNGALATVGSP